MWTVAYLPEAAQERVDLPKAERAALINADAKLSAYGPQLGYPHTSAVRAADGLRELRPRAGRSAWRALYRQVGRGVRGGGGRARGAIGPARFRAGGAPGAAAARGPRGGLMSKLSELKTASQIADRKSVV